MKDFASNLLRTSFPNMMAEQVAAAVTGMLELEDHRMFKHHMRDFLVQVGGGAPAGARAGSCCTVLSWSLRGLSRHQAGLAAGTHKPGHGYLGTQTAPAHVKALGATGVPSRNLTSNITLMGVVWCAQTKMFGSKESADLFAEETQAKLEEQRKQVAAIPGMVSPALQPGGDDMGDA